jgi:hypothetical protein
MYPKMYFLNLCSHIFLKTPQKTKKMMFVKYLLTLTNFTCFIIQVKKILYMSKNMVFNKIHALFKDVEAKCTYR